MAKKLSRHVIQDQFFQFLTIAVLVFALGSLATLIVAVFWEGIEWLDWDFLTGYPSRNPEEAGIFPALIGSFLLILIVVTISFPLGVAAAIYLEEYTSKNFLSKVLEVNLLNLAGVPSIIYGILGLGMFVYFLGLGKSVLAGGLTLALLVLPMVIIASREAIRAVPQSLREASYSLGATKWQTIWYVILPTAFSHLMTGLILAISRAIGEAAPLIVVGAVAFASFLPSSLLDSYTALPIQIYTWVSYPRKEFQELASAGIIVLLVLTFLFNGIAVYLRWKRRMKK